MTSASQYLEEAAALLKKAADTNESFNVQRSIDLNKGRERIAREFATLAAIDKGLLPAEIVHDVLRAITAHRSA